MTTPRKSRPKAEDTEGLRDWMMEMDYKLDTLLDWMQQSVERQEKHAPFIDKLMADEADRDELYKSIRGKVIGSGLIAALSILCSMIWYAITTWMGK